MSRSAGQGPIIIDRPDRPEAVPTDGWRATRAARRVPFPEVTSNGEKFKPSAEDLAAVARACGG